MQSYVGNSHMVFTFSVLDQKNPFWANLIKKIKIVSLSRNSVPKIIWKYGIQWWCHFFSFWQEIPFWANLVQKIKVVSSSWTLVPRLIWICGIQWWCSLFCFWPKFRPKIQNCLLKEKFDTKTNSNMVVVSILSVLDWK